MKVYMKQYTLFYSWQSDNKVVKTIIRNAIKAAQSLLKNEGIELLVDEDTRDRAGNKEIVREVLEKIKHCDVFLADVTPVITLTDKNGEELPKHMPNSNVMFEYGYALHCKGEGRIITLAKMEKGQYKQCMPFDINHNTLTTFKTAADLCHLSDWIKNIIVEIDKERANIVPDYDCDVVFMDTPAGSETTIKPIFKKTVYNTKQQQESFSKLNQKVEAIVKTSRRTQMFYVGKQKINKSYSLMLLWFVNNGSLALDNCNMTIQACDDRVKFAKTKVVQEPILSTILTPSNTRVYESCISFHVNTVNPGALSSLDSVYVYVPHNIGSFEMIWHLNSRTYQASGTLKVLVQPEYKVKYVENDDKAGEEQIEDYIVTE